MDDLYLDTLIDRYKHPTNKGWISQTSQGMTIERRKAHNTSCGDTFEVSFLINHGNVIDAKWRGEGCAISTVSTDIFCEWVIGKKLQELDTYSKTLIAGLTEIKSITTAREKCLYIPLNFR